MDSLSDPGPAAERAETFFPFPKRLTRLDLVLGAALAALFLWLAVTAPLSKLEAIDEPSITLLAADGTAIARRGAIVAEPVRAEKLPDRVYQAFLAIEDRRFYDHIGLDAAGVARAAWRNLTAGGIRQGGSTITQQLAKLAYLSSDRSIARKLREMLIAIWIEGALSKHEILSRYLSSVYFGDNVYGLRAASRHYFGKEPELLKVEEAAMLAGLVKAPSRLAPTSNPEGARERTRVVLRAMAEAGVLDPGKAEELDPPRVKRTRKEVPSGTYFADWVFREVEAGDDELLGRRTIRTTLDTRLQRLAVRTASRARLGGAQIAIVAMRPDGQVVAMVGGRSYSESPFNRVAQARRQPGSTFKLFVYLTALRSGMTPQTPVLDAPLALAGWAPENADGVYRGLISLRDAFTISSNVAAVRLSEQLGRSKVAATAREFGIESPLGDEPSLALGTSGVTLLELTAAFAGVAGNSFPVRPRGLDEAQEGWLSSVTGGPDSLDEKKVLPMMLDLLWSAANVGTGKAAALATPTFGKTGTSQDNRDALFVGFAKDLVTGVWIGNDDNSPLGNVSGGGLPALVWRDFMSAALGSRPVNRAVPLPLARPARRAEPPLRAYREERKGRDERKGRGERKGKGKGKGKKGKKK